MKVVLLKTVLPGGTEYCILMKIPDHIDVEKEKSKWRGEAPIKNNDSPGLCLLGFSAYLRSLGGSTISFQSCRV